MDRRERRHAAGGSQDCIGEFISQEGGRRKVYPTVKEQVVPEGKGLRRSRFILQLPLQHDRRIRHGGGSPAPPFADQFRDRNTNGSNLLPEPIHFRNQELVCLSPIAFHRGPFQFLEGVLQRTLTITMRSPARWWYKSQLGDGGAFVVLRLPLGTFAALPRRLGVMDHAEGLLEFRVSW